MKIKKIPATKETCDLCRNTKEFLENKPKGMKQAFYNQMKPLAQANLARHLKTGQHWKFKYL